MKTLYGVWNEYNDMYEVYTEDLTLAKEYVKVHEYKCGEKFTIKEINVTDSIDSIDTIYVDAESYDPTQDVVQEDYSPNFKIYTQLRNEWSGVPNEDITIALNFKRFNGSDYRMLTISFKMDAKANEESREDLLKRSKDRANTIYSLFRASNIWRIISKPTKFYFTKEDGFVITY